MKVEDGESLFAAILKRSAELESEYYAWDFRTLHVSECCYCSRAVWYRTHDENLSRQMAEDRAIVDNWDMNLGKVVHSGMQKMVEDAQVGLCEVSVGPMPIGKTGFNLLGKMDLVRWDESFTVGEITDFKTIRFTFPGLTAKRVHTLQLGIYAKMLYEQVKIEATHSGINSLDQAELGGIMSISGRLVYISKGKSPRNEPGWKPVMEFVIPTDEVRELGMQRVAEIERIIESPQWDTGPDERWMCGYCAYKAVCPHGVKA